MKKKTTRVMSVVAACATLVMIFAGFAPAKKVSAASVSGLYITNTEAQCDFTGSGNKAVIFGDAATKNKYVLKGTVSGLSGYEDVYVDITCVAGYGRGAKLNYCASNTHKKSVSINYDLLGVGNYISCGEYKVTIKSSNGKQIGSAFYYTVISKKYVQFTKDLNKFVKRDVSGFNQDAYNISLGKDSAANVARKYFSYSSFKSQMRSYSPTEFVEKLYVSILGRNYDQGGKTYWLSCLAAGQSREQIVECFINSEEFRKNF